MSDKKEKPEKAAEKPAVKVKPATKVVYTHGNKRFVIPADKDVAEFLREQFPGE